LTGPEIVKRGYDRIAARYLQSRAAAPPDMALLAQLTSRLPTNSPVLDAGCGAGVPVTRTLAERYDVTGVDFSLAQLHLARDLVPDAHFVCQDLTHLGFRDAAYAAVCSFYAIIHIPRDLHRRVLAAFHRILAPGGLALLCLGVDDVAVDIQGDYFGSPMYWSQFGEATNRRMVQEAGFKEIWSAIIPDPTYPEGGHLFILAHKSYT
jgi:SAM-dependent methyltransferase